MCSFNIKAIITYIATESIIESTNTIRDPALKEQQPQQDFGLQ